MNHVVGNRLRDAIFTPRTRTGNPLVAGLGTAAGGTLGFIAGNLPGAVLGGKAGHDLGHMVTRRKRPAPVAAEEEAEEAPPKKKSFFKKVWDNGGKHVAIAAGAAAGTYALGKGAMYLDQRSGGQYSAAIGRAANSGREAIGRLRGGGTQASTGPRVPPRAPTHPVVQPGQWFDTDARVPPAAEPADADTARTYRPAAPAQPRAAGMRFPGGAGRALTAAEVRVAADPPPYPAAAYYRDVVQEHQIGPRTYARIPGGPVAALAAEPDGEDRDHTRTYRRARQGQLVLPPSPIMERLPNSPPAQRRANTGRPSWDVPEADIQMEDISADLPTPRPVRRRGRAIADGPSTVMWEAPNVEEQANVGPSGIGAEQRRRSRHALPPDGAVHRQPTTASRRVEVGTQLYDFDEDVLSAGPRRRWNRRHEEPIPDEGNSRGTQFDPRLSYFD